MLEKRELANASFFMAIFPVKLVQSTEIKSSLVWGGVSPTGKCSAVAEFEGGEAAKERGKT